MAYFSNPIYIIQNLSQLTSTKWKVYFFQTAVWTRKCWPMTSPEVVALSGRVMAESRSRCVVRTARLIIPELVVFRTTSAKTHVHRDLPNILIREPLCPTKSILKRMLLLQKCHFQVIHIWHNMHGVGSKHGFKEKKFWKNNDTY